MNYRKIFIYLMALVWSLPMVAAAHQSQGIQNPLNSSYSTIPTFIAGFLKVMVQIGLPIVAIFMLIAGYKFASAGGNTEKLNDAKANFIYVIIGAALILGAWVLATLIGNTVQQVVGTN